MKKGPRSRLDAYGDLEIGPGLNAIDPPLIIEPRSELSVGVGGLDYQLHRSVGHSLGWLTAGLQDGDHLQRFRGGVTPALRRDAGPVSLVHVPLGHVPSPGQLDLC